MKTTHSTTLQDGSRLDASEVDGKLVLRRSQRGVYAPINLTPKDVEQVAIIFARFLEHVRLEASR